MEPTSDSLAGTKSLVPVFRRASMRLAVGCLVASAVFPSLSPAQAPADVPVFEITPVESKI
jgi:hypothetical protein